MRFAFYEESVVGFICFVPCSFDDVLTIIGVGLRGKLDQMLVVFVDVDHASRGTSVPWRWFREFRDRCSGHIDFSAG